ncbi:aspartate/glutamate racemase family protein [Actinoplanes sp. NPDC049599]|uniref:aspartate/glutamate racemase family protein n=1 Tax=Actinoplanes sp. NPDC049599 TaxID=3363903 RepID=UPI0037ABF535
MPTIGFLHTADVHVATFGALAAERGHRDVHVVDPTLLADARAHGVDAALTARLGDRLRELAGQGLDVIVCTCSTLSGYAERVELPVPVVRVDRPMAEAAVAIGGRIAVVASVASTLAPTRELLLECAVDAQVEPAPCLAAWAFFEAGDLEGYRQAVAAHVRTLDADVIVLAQASLVPAAELLGDLTVPVLTSPRSAVDHAVAVAAARRT